MFDMNRRRFLTLSLSGLALALSGCAGTDGTTLEEIAALLREYIAKNKVDGDEVNSGEVRLAITYPAGRSEWVFTSGWVFGARAFDGLKDISDSVRWSGTGRFSPETGATCRPILSEGENTITVSVDVDGKTVEKSVKVTAVSPAPFAAVGSKARCDADAHGCPACPHPTVGPIISGSPNVLINGKPAARVGDKGVAAACCGPNEFEITGGEPRVLINGRPAARKGSATRHCGGVGQIIESA